ncbi:MAG: hypothetical protein A2X34_08310 [Elusimicrobia bacterium GWC2_51_8]|nr:MAG: hypothetical protein A2X33_02480 [Elusimicrobia bacterium GWA2_51_34]OGR59350.1 MAG: hypothetical protein A2X34_08310 [Elusimicrobia bacterium GWC2_51_8]OGR86979.1 MAG: hypothetical protein A2021_01450 [Elusimicrobia bacterium GWF2_52_66]HAF96568.1 hypothetical protein [Elusimicrobiota bacterium]HCE98206.1 hypothetical protein [Elusimicrobiota bacterium]
MDAKNQRIAHDGEDTDLFELLANMRLILGEYKRFALVTPVICILAAFILAKSITPQWEATTNLTMGKVCAGDMSLPCGSSEFLTPLESLMEILADTGFRDNILKRIGVGPRTPEAVLYLKTLKVQPLQRKSNIVEIKARGYSRETVLKLVSITAEDLRNYNVAAGEARLTVLRQQLASTQGVIRGIGPLIVKSKKSSEGDSLQQVLTASLRVELESKAAALQKQLDFLEKNQAFFSEVVAPKSPVYPKTYLWTTCAGLFGIFLGIAIPLGLSFVKSLKKA